MKTHALSRRHFLWQSGGGMVAAGLMSPARGQVAKNRITAGDVIARIQKQVAIAWRTPTVDGIKGGGSQDIVVTGITTSFMSTLDVLQKSVDAGNNFVITHEPTFWTLLDQSEGPADDPLYLHKLDYIRRNRIVVFRFHDHWHGRHPDGIVEGLMHHLGWENYPVDGAHNVVELPRTVTLAALARELKTKLHTDNIRVVGNPQLKVKRVGRGFNKLAGEVGQMPFADAFIVKEADRENDLVEWCRDTVQAGQDKGYIFISHNRGEEYGMENCARWVRTFTPEVPVRFLPSGDSTWRSLRAS